MELNNKRRISSDLHIDTAEKDLPRFHVRVQSALAVCLVGQGSE
jgi:hypothetical protein